MNRNVPSAKYCRLLSSSIVSNFHRKHNTTTVSDLNFCQTLLFYHQSSTRNFSTGNNMLSEKKFSKEKILTNFLKLARSGSDKQFSVEGFQKDVGTEGYFKAFIATNNTVRRIDVPDSSAKSKTSSKTTSSTKVNNTSNNNSTRLKGQYSIDDIEEEDIEEIDEDDDIQIGSVNEFGYTYKGDNSSLNAINVLKQAEEFLLKNKSVKGFGKLKPFETSNPFMIEQNNISQDMNTTEASQQPKKMKEFPSEFPLPETSSPVKDKVDDATDENIAKDFHDEQDEDEQEDPQIFVHSEAVSLYQFFKTEMDNLADFDYKQPKWEVVQDLSTEQLDELLDLCGEDTNLVRYADSPQLSLIEIDEKLSMQEIIEKMKNVSKRLTKKKGDVEYTFALNKDTGKIERKKIIFTEDVYKPIRLNTQNEDKTSTESNQRKSNEILDMILEKLSGKSIQELTKEEIEDFKQKIKQVPELLSSKALGPLVNKFYETNSSGADLLSELSFKDVDNSPLVQNALDRVWDKEKSKVFKQLFGEEFSNEEIDYIIQTPEFERMMDSPSAKHQLRQIEEYEQEVIRPSLELLDDKTKMSEYKQKLGFSPDELARMNLPKSLKDWQQFFSLNSGPKVTLGNKLESQLKEVGKHMREVEQLIETRGITDQEQARKIRQQVYRDKVMPILASNKK